MDQLQEQEAPDAGGEDAVVDQIGELMAQLSPEKQAQVIAKLQELLGGGDEPMPVGNVSPEGGLKGQPVGM